MKLKFYALKLSLFILTVFLAQIFIANFTELFILNSKALLESWRFLTSIFLHGSLIHLIYNLFALAFFGTILEKIIGSIRFLLIFLITGILANLISINFYSSSLGASGAIFGIIGALILLRPMLIIWAFGMPMPIFIAGILWGFGDLIGAYGFIIGSPIDNTGNIAHLSGLIFGLLFGLLFRERFTVRKTRNFPIKINEKLMRNWEERHLRDY